MDIIKELYEGLITEDEAYDKREQVMEDINKGLYREFCYVDEEGLTRCDLGAINIFMVYLCQLLPIGDTMVGLQSILIRENL